MDMDELNVKLLKRSIGRTRRHASVKHLYADRSWVEGLDIINELGGHTGCVNALSWSTSGALLASGSDDKYLNIWDYNPANLAKPFSLNTSVSTGHSANIFSVKFMPHSNDRTVVTCAGDSEVRVFDLEYGGNQREADTTSTSTRSRRFHEFFNNARWMNEGNTNARVYRSHADRAKRIVTESSPHLFLTCSEDGEVRQWDLRQPSSAYPPPSQGTRMGRYRTVEDDVVDDVPPPLISYKRFHLDLNSISCSKSQPHYIALGGAHLHCFLHDRRMLGRDVSNEQGRPKGHTPAAGTAQDEIMREATRCVRRFAPNNRRAMGARDPGHFISSGHITACKISDARPNELISSWSGDHIYSFDIVKSPDAREREDREEKAAHKMRLRERSDRKRKRAKARGSSSDLTDSSRRRPRNTEDQREDVDSAALRVRYGNGEIEDIPMMSSGLNPGDELTHIRDTLLSEAQRHSERAARSLVRLRRTLFDFSAAMEEEQDQTAENPSAELTPFTSSFTSALGQAATLLPEMEEIIRSWSYPLNPSEAQVTHQNTLRRNRQSGWRFVQAAGVLAASLGGKLQTASTAADPRMAQFNMIRPAPREDRNTIAQSIFCYDFLKAILLWINGGVSAVLEGFKSDQTTRNETSRFPLAHTDTVDMVPDKLRDYLLSLASNKAVIDLGTNRFERADLRAVFTSQQAAVRAFIGALSDVELRTNQGLSGVEADSSRTTTKRIMDRGAAARFWGLKVGRSLLMDAAPDVTYSCVQHAFGGPRIRIISDEENLGHLPHVISSDEEDEREIEAIDLVSGTTEGGVDAESQTPDQPQSSTTNEGTGAASGVAPDVFVQAQDTDADLLSDDDEVDDNDLIEETEEGDTSENESDEDDTRPLYRSGTTFGRRTEERMNVNLDVPYSSHTKVYKGHCNSRTVKDVNYYGLDDEYVVSGSDDGHFFIWDRKTCEIVNILEGDGEVVNVVQGHPYEPMIACSGIDSTVKIFGPGGNSRDRVRAKRGIDIANPRGSIHSTLRYGRAGGARYRGQEPDDSDEGKDEDEAMNASSADHSDDEQQESVIARNGLRSRKAMSKCYQITSQNDAMRREGVGDAHVTEGMLARFATMLQRGELQGITAQDLGGEGGTIVLDDNCSMM